MKTEQRYCITGMVVQNRPEYSLVNPTTSKLAEMVIQGNTMGATELKKQLNAYRGSNPSVVSLAQRQLKSEEKNIEDMKQYL